jgi:hypothetical protein
MKKKIAVLMVACLGFDAFAITTVGIDAKCFALNSDQPVICTITNNSGKKCQYNIQIFQKLENGEWKDVSDNFNFLYNDFYIAPQYTEKVEIIPSFDENTQGVEFEVRVINLNTQETKTVPLKAITPVHKAIELKDIKRNSSGILQAITVTN